MGMRCSQPQGLPSEAEKFLRNNAVALNYCLHCGRHDGYKKEVIDTCGMFEDVSLYRYTLLDGSTADEFVQHCVCDSGPMEWLGLNWGGIRFLWPKEALYY